MPCDSCFFQLLSIVHEINSSFNCNPTIDVKGVFLDISKALDKVWHEGLLSKLESYGTGGELLNLYKDYLQECQQRVVLDGQSSSWEALKSGVAQGSVLGPLDFILSMTSMFHVMN